MSKTTIAGVQEEEKNFLKPLQILPKDQKSWFMEQVVKLTKFLRITLIK